MPSKAASDYAESVEPIVRKTAAWAWRLLVILTAVVALLLVVTAAGSDRRPAAARLDAERVAGPHRGLAGQAGRTPRRRGRAGVAGRLRDPRRDHDLRRQPIHRRRTGFGETGHPQHRLRKEVADRGPAASEPPADRPRRRLGDPGAAEQSGEVDQRRPVDRGHHHRNHHRGIDDAVHADLLPVRRTQHLELRHQDRPRPMSASGYKRRVAPDSTR